MNWGIYIVICMILAIPFSVQYLLNKSHAGVLIVLFKQNNIEFSVFVFNRYLIQIFELDILL